MNNAEKGFVSGMQNKTKSELFIPTTKYITGH
jgi:hypothetical protein